MKRSGWRGVVILLLTLIVTDLWSCKAVAHLAGTLRELNAISSDISSTFDEQDVRMNLQNSRYLTIQLVNSKHGDQPEADKRALARRVAEFTYNRYSSRADLEALNVVFLKSWSLVVFHYTDSRDTYHFDAKEFSRGQE